MKKINLLNSRNAPLEVFKDERGIIADVFYEHNINHVAIISSTPSPSRSYEVMAEYGLESEHLVGGLKICAGRNFPVPAPVLSKM